MAYSSSHLFFDDVEVGQEWLSPGRTVTQADIVNFAGFTGDFNPMHMDHEYAKNTPFRKPIAHGFGVFSIASGLAMQSPLMRTLALLEVRSWKFIEPVFIDDTITVKCKLLEKTLQGRGRRGQIIWQRSVVNQEGKVCQSGEVLTLVDCRAAGVSTPSLPR
jgi:3-hydroxybutyryl-CoA dehydratase